MIFSIYGLPQLAMSSSEVFLRLYLLVYFTKYIGLSGQEGASIISISLIISAFFDPKIGELIDKFKSNTGRLTPIIITAIISLSIVLGTLFIPNWSKDQYFILLIITVLYQISYSLFLIPYLSLAKYLIKKEEDIITLYGWRYIWGSFGALLGVSLPFIQTSLKTESYAPIGTVIIFLLGIFGPASLYYLKEKRKKVQIHQENKSVNTFSELGYLFKNRPFLFYFLAFTILSIGLGINQTLAVYYYKDGLKLESNEVNQLLAFYMLIFSVSIPFWVKFAKKVGKRNTLRIGLIIVGLCTLFYPFIPERGIVPLYLVAGTAGLFTGVVILIDAYLSNIIDYHNFKRKFNKNNFIFGVWRISDKLSRAFGVYLAGILLDITLSPNQNYINIKQVFGFGVFIFIFLAALLLLIQRFNERHHEIVMNFLKKKRSELL